MEVDIHTHTIVSGHAYSTLNEMLTKGKERGLKVIATTDHGPKMPGGPHIYHFYNLRALPKYFDGIRVLKGVEANIVNYRGAIDIPKQILNEMELVIASFHNPCIKSASIKKVTKALISVMKNKHVNVIGHPEDNRYPFDIKEIVKLSKESKTLLEINNSSLLPTTFRIGAKEGIVKILEECGKENVPVVLGSDSHHTSLIGVFDSALSLINEVGFPEELIINKNSKDFLNYIGVDA